MYSNHMLPTGQRYGLCPTRGYYFVHFLDNGVIEVLSNTRSFVENVPLSPYILCTLVNRHTIKDELIKLGAPQAHVDAIKGDHPFESASEQLLAAWQASEEEAEEQRLMDDLLGFDGE